MPAQGESRDYDEQAMFRLEIDGIPVTRFKTCSAFTDTSAVVEGREGGVKKVVVKTDGTQSYENITLARQSDSRNEDLYAWRQIVKTQGAKAAYRNASIVKLDPDGSEKGRIDLFKAWPPRYQEGGWDASSDDYVMEEIELAFTDAERVAAV